MQTKSKTAVRWIVWLACLALCGGVVWMFASSQCICGHRGMDPGLGGGLFAGFTVIGLIVGRRLDQESEFSGTRGLVASVALMFVGVFAAIVFAGNDLDAAHKNMFQPADPAKIGDVEF